MTNDIDFVAKIISEICDYAKSIGDDPDRVIKTVAEMLLEMLELCSFNSWEGEADE